ncbi:MAG: AAA family ATPase [Candidatus Helarchaeota archaeon]
MIKLESIVANGFKNLRIGNLIFPPEGNILIKGKNESGKSTLFEAIVFALTSSLLVKKTGGYQDAIAFDKEMAVIELKFQKNGVPARIRKIISRTPTGSSLYIYFWINYGQANEKLYEGKSKDIDPIIEDFLGFDKDVLINSSFVKQKGLDGFSNETPKVRKKIINKLLNIEKLTKLQEKYEKELKNKKIKEQYIENLNNIKKSNENISNLNKKSNELNQLKQEYDKYNKEYQKILQLKEQLKVVMDKINEYNSEIIQLERKLEEVERKKSVSNKYKGIIERIEHLKNENEKKNIELSSKNKDSDKINAEIENYIKNIENYHKQKHDLQELSRELEQESINLNKFEEWEKKFENIENIKRELISVEKDIQNYQERITEKNRNLIDMDNNLRKDIIDLRETILNNLKEINNQKSKLKELKFKIQKLSNVKNDKDVINNFKNYIEKTNRELKIKEDRLSHLKEKKEDYYKIKEKIENFKKSILTKKNEYENLKRNINDLFIKKKEINTYHNYMDTLNITRYRIETVNNEIAELKQRKKQIEDSLGVLKDYTAIISEKNNEINDLIKEEKELENKFLEFEKSYFKGILNLVNQSLKKQPIVLSNKFIAVLIASIASFFIFLAISLIINPFYLIGSLISITILGLILIKKFMNKPTVDNNYKSKIIDHLKSHLKIIPQYPERIITVESIPKPNEIDTVEDILIEQIRNLEGVTSSDIKNNLSKLSNSKKISLEILYDFNNEIFEKYNKLSKTRHKIELLRDDLKQKNIENERNLETRKNNLKQKDEIDKQIKIYDKELRFLEEKYTRQIENNKNLKLEKPDISVYDVEDLITRNQEELIRIEENIKKSKEYVSELEMNITSIPINEIEKEILELEKFYNILKENLARYQERQQKFLNGIKTDEIESEIEYDQLNSKINNLKKEKTQIEINISNKREEISQKLRELGLELKPMDLDNSIKIKELTTDIIKKLEQQHFLKSIDEYNSFYSEIPVYLNYKDAIKEIFDSITKNKNMLDEMKNKRENINELKSALLMDLPDTYRENIDEFKKDYKDKNSRIEIIKENISNIKDYLEKYNLNEFEKDKKMCLESLKIIENEIKSIKQIIQNNEDVINDLKNKIPKDYNEDGVSITLNEYNDKSGEINKKITENKTRITQIWGNYYKKLTETIRLLQNLEYFKEKRIEITQINYKNTTEIFKILNELINDLEKILNENRGLISELVGTEQSIEDIEEFYNNIINNWAIEKGGYENLIEISENQINELMSNKQKKKIIESENILIENIENEYNNIKEERENLENAIDILKEGEIKISQKVLPKTRENLSRVLPMLTADRYKDAIITENYEIKVFDSKLGNYVSKVLFSGGTNDQIALAFRLAFAMATIEDDKFGESFIFLDEPIGFFDDERRSSLLNFLTSGDITKKFAQRIVVSNFLDIEQYFDYIIELDNGMIINQITTGSLETIQFDEIYVPLMGEKFLDLNMEDSIEEDGYCEQCLILKNISDKEIESIYLKKLNQNLNFNIVPIYINKLKPSDGTLLNLNYHVGILDDDSIVINAHFKYYDDTGEKYGKQKFEIKP